MPLRLAIALLCLGFVPIAAADVRIGVWSEPSQRDLAADVGANLSALPDVRVLERDELDRLADEQKLAAAFSSDSAAVKTNITGVDCLIFLGDAGGNVRARIVSVRHGLVLADLLFPGGQGVATMTKAILDPLPALLKKVTASVDSLAVSILNLHSTLGDKTSLEVESALNPLLESRLAAEPQVFILDRRTLDQLQKEKAFDGDDSPFRSGVWVVEGSIDPGGDQTVIRLTLNLRRQHPAATVSVTVDGDTDHLPELAGKAVKSTLAAIRKPATGAAAWNPPAEAWQFAKEAVWAWRRNDSTRALAAIASANALGLQLTDLAVLRVTFLAHKLDSRDSKNSDDDDDDDEEARPAVIPLEELRTRLADADELLLAYHEAVALEARDGFRMLDPNKEAFINMPAIRGMTCIVALRVLRQATETSGAKAATKLRQKLRELTGFDPRAGKIPLMREVINGFAGYLADDIDELFAYYRGLLGMADPDARFWAMHVLWNLRHQQSGITPKPLEPNAEKREATLRDFLAGLSSDPATRHMALWLEVAGAASPEDRAALEGKYLDDIYTQRERLLRDGRFHQVAWEIIHLDPSDKATFKPEKTRMIIFLLENSETHDEAAFSALWKPEQMDDAQAPRLWKAFLGYRDRAIAQAPEASKDERRHFFRVYAEKFGQAFPSVVQGPVANAPAAMQVTRFWEPPVDDELARFYRVRTLGNRIALPNVGMHGRYAQSVIMLDLPTGKMDVFHFGFLPIDVLLTPSAWFPISSASGGEKTMPLIRFDFATGRREDRSIIPYHHQGNLALGEMLYLTGWTDNEHSMMRYDWSSGREIILASSRRKPTQNQFDNTDEFSNGDFFAGPGGAPCVLVKGQPWLVRDTPGDWPPLLPVVNDDGPHPRFSAQYFWRRIGDESPALFRSERGDVILVDPARDKPVPLMVSARTGSLLPEWAKAAKWDVFSFDDIVDRDQSMVATKHGVFSLHRKPPEAGGYYYLRWFADDGPRSGTEIRLDFKTPPLPAGLTKEAIDRAASLDINGNSRFARCWIYACDEGLLLTTLDRGFFLLPFSDLEAFRKKQTQTRN